MSDIPRQAKISITYSGSGRINSQTLKARIKEFTYEDPATGESDIISVGVDNVASYFLKRSPAKGSKITANIHLYSWKKYGDHLIVKCGKFCCDSKEFSGWPLEGTIGATSVPEKQAFRATQRSKTWKKVTIREIASKICKKYAIKLTYDAGTISIKKIEQTSKTDCSFLTELCEKYGLYIKVYAGKVYIYDPVKYESKRAKKSIDIKNMLSWNYVGSLVGTYTGGTIKYTAGEKEKEYTCKVGSGSRIYHMSEKVDSLADAKRQITAKVNQENRSAETMTCTIKADPDITSGINITVKGAEKVNGKYFIDKVVHNVSGNAAYTMELTMHKVQASVGKKKTAPAKKTTTTKKKPTTKPTTKPKVGQIVNFTGTKHYISADSTSPKRCKPGKAKVTIVHSGKHPYHLVAVSGGGSTVYGWVDASDIS